MELEDGWFWKMRGVSTFETKRRFLKPFDPGLLGEKLAKMGVPVMTEMPSGAQRFAKFLV